MARFAPASLPSFAPSAERGQAFLALKTPEDPTERARKVHTALEVRPFERGRSDRTRSNSWG